MSRADPGAIRMAGFVVAVAAAAREHGVVYNPQTERLMLLGDAAYQGLFADTRDVTEDSVLDGFAEWLMEVIPRKGSDPGG